MDNIGHASGHGACGYFMNSVLFQVLSVLPCFWVSTSFLFGVLIHDPFGMQSMRPVNKYVIYFSIILIADLDSLGNSNF